MDSALFYGGDVIVGAGTEQIGRNLLHPYESRTEGIMRQFGWVMDVAWVIALMAYVIAGAGIVPFHGDEATQVYMSRDYAYQFIERDLSRVVYSDPPVSAQEQELRLLNGTVNKYLIGLMWHAAGFTIEDVNEQWDWGADWTYNQSTGHAPSPELLRVARIPSTVLLALGVIPIFGLGRLAGGSRVSAYAASAIYALSPALLAQGRRAMMEGSFIAFNVLTVWAAAMWGRKSQFTPPYANGEGRKDFIWAVALGVAAGLAIASKHTALFAVGSVFVGAGLWVIVNRFGTPSPYKEVLVKLAQLVFAGGIAGAVFLAVNPAWWGDPLARVGEVLDLRTWLLEGQTAAFGGYESLGDAAAGFFRQVFVGLPQYYEVPVWGEYIGDQIAAYESSIWRGVSIGGSVIGGSVFAALVVMGFVRVMRRGGGMCWVIGAWVIGVVMTTVVFTPLEWQRYYLPVIPVVGVLAGAGVERLYRR